MDDFCILKVTCLEKKHFGDFVNNGRMKQTPQDCFFKQKDKMEEDRRGEKQEQPKQEIN